MGICVCERANDGTFCFKDPDASVKFLFLISDFSAFGNPVKKSMKICENFRKTTKLLLENALDEFQLMLRTGNDFAIGPPIINKKINEPKVLKLTITIPPGEAIKVYSIDDAYYMYVVNEEGKFTETEDYQVVEEKTGLYF